MTIAAVFYVLLGITVIFGAWIGYLEYRLSRLLRGASGRDLESVITTLKEHLDHLERLERELRERTRTIDARLKRSIQHVHTVRFNPFENAGSNQSFATALLNEHGDGAVISALYSRERVGVYAKPVKDRKSEYHLSEEEERAINGT